jgi:hypothetical protein
MQYVTKTYGGVDGSRFIDLGTSWSWVVSFTLLSLYPQGNSHSYPLDSRLGCPQSRSGLHSWSYLDSNSTTSVIQPVASRYTDWADPFLWLWVWTDHARDLHLSVQRDQQSASVPASSLVMCGFFNVSEAARCVFNLLETKRFLRTI